MNAMKQGRMVVEASMLAAAVLFIASAIASRGPAALARPVIDASSLRHRILCGYQGWFRCAGDAAGEVAGAAGEAAGAAAGEPVGAADFTSLSGCD